VGVRVTDNLSRLCASVAHCIYCGAPDPGTLDHVVPVAQGGALGPLVPACVRCNQSKHARTPGQWLTDVTACWGWTHALHPDPFDADTIKQQRRTLAMEASDLDVLSWDRHPRAVYGDGAP